MANVQGKFYTAETQRRGVTPSSPPNAVDDPQDPLNPPGSGGGGGTVIENYTQSPGTIRFDLPRSYGYNGTLVNSDLEIDLTGAKEINMAKVLHQSASVPSVSIITGSADLHLSGGGYDPAKINEFLFICHKNGAGTVVRVSYSISPNLL